VVAVDLHLDEVIAAADRAELRLRLRARARDPLGVERALVDRDVLALAELGRDAERPRAKAQDLLALGLAAPRHVPRAVAAHPGRDPRLHRGAPAAALVLA